MDAIEIGFSYIRYSHPDQKKGDSLRRQTEATAEWCRRNKVTLDASLHLADEGVSAFRGKHRGSDRYALGRFLAEVQAGRVPRGSYLIIENLDRLSREEERPALRLWMDILDAGVNIVQLHPETVFRHDKSDMIDIMRAIIELSRGHSESRMKSERVGAAWENKKALARAERSVQTTRCPAWLEVVGRRKEGKHAVGGEYRIIPARAEVVRRIFALAVGGEGVARIVGKLARVPCWGRAKKWTKAYVRKILTSRGTLGEYQPRKSTRGQGARPEGEPIADFYPAVIDPETWQKAQAALAGRRDRPGSPGKRTSNLFSGLLWDAASQSRMLIAWQTRGVKGRRKKLRVLTSADSMEGRGPSTAFPHQLFEDAVLSMLGEVDAAELGNGHSEEVAAAEKEVADLLTAIKSITDDLEKNGESPTQYRRLREKERALPAAQARLADARRKEHNPPAAALASAQPLLLATRDPEKRQRLRQLLRACVEEVWVLVVPRGAWRLCAAQVFFAGGRRREYLIAYRSAGFNRQAVHRRPHALGAVPGAGEIDLRRRADAEKLRAFLEALPVEAL